jgi:uncharacterized protein YbaA (DUF1428 family)
MASKCSILLKEFSALRIAECWGDALPDGKVRKAAYEAMGGLPFDGKRVVYGGFETLIDA